MTQIEIAYRIASKAHEGFQSGQYACEDNAEALFHLRAALSALQRRTRARLARGVEGTNTI